MDLAALERAISNLEKSLDSLETWLTWMTGAVVLGLIVEYWHEIPDAIAKIRKERRWLWKPACIIIGAVLITVGVAGELLVQFRASRVETEIRADSQQVEGLLSESASKAVERAGQANERAGKTIERASKADERSEVLRKQNLSLQSNLLRLRKESEPRRLTGAQKDKLVTLLQDDQGVVAIVSKILDSESSDFADDFDVALQKAGWKTVRVLNRISRRYGVAVGTVTGGTVIGDTRGLMDALVAIGINVESLSIANGDCFHEPCIPVWRALLGGRRKTTNRHSSP